MKITIRKRGGAWYVSVLKIGQRIEYPHRYLSWREAMDAALMVLAAADPRREWLSAA